jgi:hypothetical protein
MPHESLTRYAWLSIAAAIRWPRSIMGVCFCSFFFHPAGWKKKLQKT